MKQLRLQFLGYGNASAACFGNSAAVLHYEMVDAQASVEKTLAIDFGFSAFHEFKNRFDSLPDSVFITHGHLDHIGGLESLFFAAYFQIQAGKLAPIKLFVPHKLVSLLQQRLGSLDNILAEGGANFWDAFQLIPVGDSFWLDGMQFYCFAARHHSPGFAYGLSLPGSFLFSGDTKPIPEVVSHYASHNEIIFHDVCLQPQPSHTFIAELSAYTPAQLSRMWFYHVDSDACIAELQRLGLKVVSNIQVFQLSPQRPQNLPQQSPVSEHPSLSKVAN